MTIGFMALCKNAWCEKLTMKSIADYLNVTNCSGVKEGHLLAKSVSKEISSHPEIRCQTYQRFLLLINLVSLPSFMMVCMKMLPEWRREEQSFVNRRLGKKYLKPNRILT